MDVQQIEAAGLTGELSVYTANNRYGSGKKATSPSSCKGQLRM
jgi:hypothetical protein